MFLTHACNNPDSDQSLEMNSKEDQPTDTVEQNGNVGMDTRVASPVATAFYDLHRLAADKDYNKAAQYIGYQGVDSLRRWTTTFNSTDQAELMAIKSTVNVLDNWGQSVTSYEISEEFDYTKENQNLRGVRVSYYAEGDTAWRYFGFSNPKDGVWLLVDLMRSDPRVE